MLALLAALVAPALAEDLRVEVPDTIHHMALVCGTERTDRTREDGVPTGNGKLAYTFPIYPGRNCEVVLVQTVGSLEQLGTWSCSNSGCTRTDSGPGPVSVAPGEVKLLLADELPHTELELSCASGYRARVPLADHQGSFQGVPDGVDCTVNLKGGPPLKFSPLSPGAWQCHLVAGTLICKRR